MFSLKLVSLTLAALCSSSFAVADDELNPNRELACETQGGAKILVNDSLTGPGKALVGSAARLLNVSVSRAGEFVRVAFNGSVRAPDSETALLLDPSEAEYTTRIEGGTVRTYHYVPARVEGLVGWNGRPEISAKCFQPAL